MRVLCTFATTSRGLKLRANSRRAESEVCMVHGAAGVTFEAMVNLLTSLLLEFEFHMLHFRSVQNDAFFQLCTLGTTV